MFFSRNIKTDGKTDADEIKTALIKGYAVFNTYIIALTKQGKTEILSCSQALKSANRPQELKVIGMAAGKEGALALLASIYLEYGSQEEIIKKF